MTLIALLVGLAIAAPTSETEKINRFCANAVGIPYASDNFTDAEWKDFQSCVRFHTRK